jgi:hypothetical protein
MTSPKVTPQPLRDPSPPAAKRQRVEAVASTALATTPTRTMQALICSVGVYSTSEYGQIAKWNFCQAAGGLLNNWEMHSLSLCSKELYAATPKRGLRTEGGFAQTCQVRALELYPVASLIAGEEAVSTPTGRDAVALLRRLNAGFGGESQKLVWALQEDHERARLFLDLGIGCRTPPLLLSNALTHPIASSTQIVLAKLVERGADLNAPFMDRTPLMTVSTHHPTKGPHGWLRLLLSMGAKVNTENGDGDTVLHHAARTYTVSSTTLSLLLKAGADITARNDENETPLDCAQRTLRNLLKEKSYKFTPWISNLETNINLLEVAEAVHKRAIATKPA